VEVHAGEPGGATSTVFRAEADNRLRRTYLRHILVVIAASLLGLGTARANLVANGGFEGSGTCGFAGWTIFGQTVAGTDYGLIRASEGGIPFDGNCSAWFGPVGGETILSQYVPTLAGQQYFLSVWVRNTNLGSAPDNHFQIIWEGTPLLTADNAPDAPWTHLSGIITASVSSSFLAFVFRNVPGYFSIDDVSVDPVPEPGAFVLCAPGLALVFLIRRARDRRTS
jgi:hypothetical protein